MGAIILHVDSECEEREAIIEGTLELAYVVNGQIDLIVPEGFDFMASAKTHAVYCVDSMHPVAKRHPNALGVSTVGGRHAFIIHDRIAATGADTATVVRHEVSHLLGSVDRPGTWRLMDPVLRAGEVRCVDEDAALQIAAANGLDFTRMNWCRP